MTSKSSITTRNSATTLEPIAPGEILVEEFLKPLNVSQNRLARDICVPVSRIAAIVNGSRAITADTALRLAHYFGTSPDMWLRLQNQYDLRRALLRDWPTVRLNLKSLAN